MLRHKNTIQITLQQWWEKTTGLKNKDKLHERIWSRFCSRNHGNLTLINNAGPDPDRTIYHCGCVIALKWLCVCVVHRQEFTVGPEQTETNNPTAAVCRPERPPSGPPGSEGDRLLTVWLWILEVLLSWNVAAEEEEESNHLQISEDYSSWCCSMLTQSGTRSSI